MAGPTKGGKQSGFVQGEAVTDGGRFQLNTSALRNQVISTPFDQYKQQREADAEEAAAKIIHHAQLEAENILKHAQAKAAEKLQYAEEQAAEKIAEAQQTYGEMVGQAEEILEKTRQQGYEEGFEKGETDGRDQAEADTIAMLLAAQALLKGALEGEKQVIKNIRTDIVELIRHISKKILLETAELNPEESVLKRVDAAITNLHLSGLIKVVVSKQLLNSIQAFSEKTTATLQAMDRVQFISDPLLALTDCYVIAKEGNFDLSLHTQVETLTSNLLHQLPKELNYQNESELDAGTRAALGGTSTPPQEAPEEPAEELTKDIEMPSPILDSTEETDLSTVALEAEDFEQELSTTAEPPASSIQHAESIDLEEADFPPTPSAESPVNPIQDESGDESL